MGLHFPKDLSIIYEIAKRKKGYTNIAISNKEYLNCAQHYLLFKIKMTKYELNTKQSGNISLFDSVIYILLDKYKDVHCC